MICEYSKVNCISYYCTRSRRHKVSVSPLLPYHYHASDGYNPGQIISSPEANETGNIDYSEIISTHNYGYDTGYTEGAVHVVSYIDGESSNEPHLTYNFTNFNLAAGNAGLGSENFYIFDYPDPEAFNSFNEADLTSNTVRVSASQMLLTSGFRDLIMLR